MTATLDRSTAPTTESATSVGPATPRGGGPHRGSVARWWRRHSRSAAWFLPAFVIGLIAQIVNIAGSPQRIDDEGTYTAQAYAVERFGELAHYTYWYDHPPLGWLQIAGYTSLTGAFERYDVAVMAAREFMVVMTMLAAILLWVLARRLHFSRSAAAAATLLFTLSPLALQFHRTAYLDNIATVWLLAALVLAMGKRRQLASFVGSAACFGVAVLTKETFLLALPLVAWFMWRGAHPSTRRYTLSVSAAVLGLIGFTYVLLALVKNELVPGSDRVSLMEGIGFQLSSRASSGSLFDPESLAGRTLGMWWQLDPVFITASVIAGLVALGVPRLRAIAIAFLVLVAFMFRPGSYLPVPYVIVLIPLGALLVAGVVQMACATLRGSNSTATPMGTTVGGGRKSPRRKPARKPLAVLVLTGAVAAVAVGAPGWATQLRGFFLADLDLPGRQAQEWVESNVDKDSRLIVDDAMWVDLVRAGFDRDNVLWYYKLDTDPAVQAQSPNGWRDADYVIATDSMRTLPNTGDNVSLAIQNSVVAASFGTGSQQVDVRRIDPNGIEQAQADEADGYAYRSAAGIQLGQNPELQLGGKARELLEDGLVDSRAIVGLGQLLSTRSVTIADFPDGEGETGPAKRQVLLSSMDGRSLLGTAEGSEDATAELATWFRQLGDPLAPESVRSTAEGAVITYSFGEPVGLLPRAQN